MCKCCYLILDIILQILRLSFVTSCCIESRIRLVMMRGYWMSHKMVVLGGAVYFLDVTIGVSFVSLRCLFRHFCIKCETRLNVVM